VNFLILAGFSNAAEAYLFPTYSFSLFSNLDYVAEKFSL